MTRTGISCGMYMKPMLRRSITQSQGGKEYPTYSKKKEV
jgi:hypothetical protein